MATFFDPVRASAADPAPAPAVRRAAEQRYAHLRVSRKEPFDLLDATYTGLRNIELRLRLAVNRGDASTEFGEKAVRSRLELRARVFF